MAQKKISQLTAAEALAGTEVFAVVQGGATDGGSIEQIREYVASQPNVFSVTQRIESAAPELQFSENDTVDKNWGFIGVAGALRLDELNDAFLNTGTHHTFTHGGGTQFGSPTGGDQGAGTVNATGLYENGTGVAKLSGGADANFTAMPQVGGDPIVESGSNAAGEFTKWADGSMRNTVHRLTLPFGSNNECIATWTLPQAFVDADFSVGAVFLPMTDAASANSTASDATPATTEVTGVNSGEYTTTSVELAAMSIAGLTDFVSGDNMYVSVIAEGYWK